MSCVCHAFASVHCCLVVTCWERADLLPLACDVYCVYITFPRLISVVDVVGPVNPYQPIPFHMLSLALAVFQSRILIYAGSDI